MKTSIQRWETPGIVLIVAGLDIRYGWPPELPIWVQIAMLAVLILGILFFNWALITNRFFSSHLRIQTDRGHVVDSSGPLRIVRHPGNAGDALAWIAGAFLFSSYWAAIPTVIILLAYIVCIRPEDRILQEELPGNKEYASKVRYRFVLSFYLPRGDRCGARTCSEPLCASRKERCTM